VAGRGGVVVCCDTADCSGQVLVSWDFFTDGKGDANQCVGDHPPVFDPNSATWLDPRVTLLGQAFDQCGTLVQGLQGCIQLQTDTGQVYNLFDGGWLNSSVGERGPFHFGDRVRVQGLLTTTRRIGVFYICPGQDGDIYSPVLSSCTSSTPPGPISIVLGGSRIQLMPDLTAPGPGFTFSGCADVTINLNFRAQLSVTVTPAPGVGGTWRGSVTPLIVGPGTATVQICVEVAFLDLSTLPPGSNPQVATVALLSVPAP
jgi:hypothetical protein